MPHTETQDVLVDKIALHVKCILELLGLDVSDPDIRDTPIRVARMLLELTSGLRESPPEVKFFKIQDSAKNNLVIVRNIEFESLCEHHLLPIVGHVDVVFKPREPYVPGLSKVVRLVQWKARRPMLQEKFTQDLATFLLDRLKAKFVYCHVVALHTCILIRGPRSRTTLLETEAIAGDVDVELSELRQIVRSRSYVFSHLTL